MCSDGASAGADTPLVGAGSGAVEGGDEGGCFC